MSYTDALTRALGHDDNYESDDNAAASYYRLTHTDARLFAIADALDMRPHARTYFPHQPAHHYLNRHDHAYVRSNDRGFWDMIPCTETEAAAYLQAWVEANVPRYCDACACPLTDDEIDAYGDACERCATTFFHCNPL